MTNAIDTLRQHNCSDNFYQHMFGMVYTDGVKAFADNFQAYWFVDIVVSYQPEHRREGFQVWSLTKHEDDSAIVKCTDGNDRTLCSQVVDYTDFKATAATVWVEGNTILLPSEH